MAAKSPDNDAFDFVFISDDEEEQGKAIAVVGDDCDDQGQCVGSAIGVDAAASITAAAEASMEPPPQLAPFCLGESMIQVVQGSRVPMITTTTIDEGVQTSLTSMIEADKDTMKDDNVDNDEDDDDDIVGDYDDDDDTAMDAAEAEEEAFLGLGRCVIKRMSRLEEDHQVMREKFMMLAWTLGALRAENAVLKNRLIFVEKQAAKR